MKGIFAITIFMAISFVMSSKTVPSPQPLSYRISSELSNLRRLL